MRLGSLGQLLLSLMLKWSCQPWKLQRKISSQLMKFRWRFESEQSETKQRIASLVVLPPIVLGYDELYQDSTEAEKNYTPKKRLRKSSPSNTETPIRPRAEEIVELPQKTNPPTKNELAATPVKKEQTVAVQIKKKQPVVVPVTKKQPNAAPVTKKKPAATPVPKKQPVVVPVTKKQPNAAPVTKKQTAAAPVPKKQPNAAPVTKKQPRATPVKKKQSPPAPVTKKRPAAAPVTKKPPVTISVKKKQPVAAPVKKKAKLSKKNKKTRRKHPQPQRTIIIDTKGRRNFRRNYRSILKKLKQDNRQDSWFIEEIDINKDGNTALEQVPISGEARWSNSHGGGIITWRQN